MTARKLSRAKASVRRSRSSTEVLDQSASQARIQRGKISRKKVIVVGAGLAGLASAYELAKKGHEVVMLEARDRVGGRVETLRKPFSGNHSAEAGAYWLNDRHTVAMGYFLELGLGSELTYVPLSEKPLFLQIKNECLEARLIPGFPWPKSLGLHSSEMKMGLGGILGSVFCDHDLLGDPSEKGWPPDSVKKKYGNMTFWEFLKSPHRIRIRQSNEFVPYIPSEGAIELIRPWFAWWDEEFHKLSALSMIQYGDIGQRLCENWVHPAKWFTVPRGMDIFPKTFVKNVQKLGATIYRNAPVLSIKQSESSVTIEYLLPSEKPKKVTGDYLICTIPLTTLRKIKFQPKLSDVKRSLIKNIEYASVARVYIQGKKKFINLKNSAGFTDLPVGNLLDMSFHNKKGPGRLLQAFMIGKHARAFGRKDKEGKKNFAITELQKLFPSLKGQNIARFADKCWDDDPWACGAYPIFTPDQFHSRGELANSEGRIYFAGEHTSEYTGWMEGALRSGQQAASDVHIA